MPTDALSGLTMTDEKLQPTFSVTPNTNCPTMKDPKDEVFCHLIARRAVARAALHLGVDGMSEEALESLSGVLIAYLERVGTSLAVSVESSGRSSSHCNALDAVRAVELCTTCVAQRVHHSEKQQEGWKGLASFLFGPNWHQAEDTPQRTAGSGKVGPSSGTAAPIGGWSAPYPDELPPFPVTTTATAAEAASKPQPEEEPDIDIDTTPEEVFTREWASLDPEPTTPSDDNPMEPPTKKQKLENPYASFFPPFPRATLGGRTVVETDANQDDSATEVRSALVNIGAFEYWGEPTGNLPPIEVPLGRSEGDTSNSIVPLGRASGSRVSRILEGSMD
jgi:hypothetical protein